jgi:hypothetical protein
MRAPFQVHGKILVGTAVFVAVALASPHPAQALTCSALRGHPCIYRPFHQVCGVFHRRPCIPELQYPFTEQLQLTIESRDRESDAAREREKTDREGSEMLGSIRAVFDALRSCWTPPAKEDSRPGAQLSVRLSFKRNGEIFGKPRVTYVTPGIPDSVRQAYWDAIAAAVERCTPLPFTAGLGGALAGRPFAIRFVDRRSSS